MRWVSYLSPSGGERRAGLVEDGCVFGYPGAVEPAELLGLEEAELQAARERALEEPVEIIVEFEARLCAPVRPSAPIRVHLPEGGTGKVEPHLVGGPDDGVALGEPGGGLYAAVGVAALDAGDGAPVGHAIACLWRDAERRPLVLTLGPGLSAGPEVEAEECTVTAWIADDMAAIAVGAKVRGETGVRLTAETRLMEPGEELYLEGGPLGSFEMRAGFRA